MEKCYAASMNLFPGVSDRHHTLSFYCSVKPVYITYVLSKFFSTPLICWVELRTTETSQCCAALGMQVDLVLWLGAGDGLTEITKAAFCNRRIKHKYGHQYRDIDWSDFAGSFSFKGAWQTFKSYCCQKIVQWKNRNQRYSDLLPTKTILSKSKKSLSKTRSLLGSPEQHRDSIRM